MEAGGAVFDADEVALDQRGERGRGDGEAAQLGDREFVGGSGELGEDGLLVGVQPGQAAVFYEHCVADGAAGVARSGSGFADDPLLAQHAGEEMAVGSGGAMEGGRADGFAGFEPVFKIVEDFVFGVLLFGREARAARASLLCAFEEGGATELGDAVEHLLADLAHEREHGAENFSDGSDVVLGDPLGEVKELRREDRFFVKDVEDGTRFDGWRVIVQAEDDASHFLVAEGDEDAGSDGWGGGTERVGEGAVKRDRQGYVAEGGHWRQGTGFRGQGSSFRVSFAALEPSGRALS